MIYPGKSATPYALCLVTKFVLEAATYWFRMTLFTMEQFASNNWEKCFHMAGVNSAKTFF